MAKDESKRAIKKSLRNNPIKKSIRIRKEKAAPKE